MVGLFVLINNFSNLTY